MPVPDETPSRRLVIRRGRERYIVDEAKYDTVVIVRDDGETGTYKALGFDIVNMIVDGTEQPYVKREHIGAVPGRDAVAAEQVATLTATGDPVPAVVARAAGVDDPLPESRPARAEDSSTASRNRRAASDT